MEPIRGLWRGLENCKKWLWRKVLNISWSDKVFNEEACRWGESHHMCYQQKTASLAWSYPTAWWSCPISYWGNNRKEATRKTSKGNAGQREGWQPLRSSQEVENYKEGPACGKNTHMHSWLIYKMHIPLPKLHICYIQLLHIYATYMSHICHMYLAYMWHVCQM